MKKNYSGCGNTPPRLDIGPCSPGKDDIKMLTFISLPFSYDNRVLITVMIKPEHIEDWAAREKHLKLMRSPKIPVTLEDYAKFLQIALKLNG